MPATPIRETRRLWARTMLILSPAVLATAASCARIPGFAPAMAETPQTRPDRRGDVRFDHARFDRLLKSHVDAEGMVNYTALASDQRDLDAYLVALEQASLESMGRDEKLAFLINAYNACTLRLILDYDTKGTLKSIKNIPASKRWKDERWSIAGSTWSLNQIEHEQIRKNFAEPRIHFALVCAAIGCPPLRPEAYVAHRLEQQLAAQTLHVHTNDRWYRYDADRNVLRLTKLYDWYGGDFKQAAGSVLDYAARQDRALAAALTRGDQPSIKWLAYDWSLNRRKP